MAATTAHEAAEQVAYAVEYRATAEAAYREYLAAREWDKAVPALHPTR